MSEPLAGGSLVNADLAPTPIEARTWGRWHIASLWVGLSVCIPTYLLAASMIQADLYRRDGVYGYTDGLNWPAIAATIAGILVASSAWSYPAPRFLFSGAWFSAAIVSFVTYYALMRRKTP